MEPQRFDAITRSFATRFSRRSAVRTGGIGLAATMLATLGVRGASARQASSPWYTVIRSYRLSGSSTQVQNELKDGFLPLLRQADGFVEYSVVASSNDMLTTITVFESQDQEQSAAQSEEDWVQQNLASLLPTPATKTMGDAVVYGINDEVICAGPAQPTATAAAASASASASASATATATPCTGIGCDCNGGVQDSCDDGLVCCQSQMGGGPIPGGAGMCAAADACGDGAATPTTPCTGIGCECESGVEDSCDDGLVCCQSQMGGGPTPGGSGMCAASDACGD